ncbi:DUF3156 family protein [Serratia plymuthica]|uniref:DUF3156 family protein n=1 Tax=Serratia plymuthica TaxID=82996 RepID=A0A2X4TU79_SERPL|nr:DUF3156 family protein [Serratia plymuthica]QPS22628.1 DUF3156 family protein [Serratia plymuthica]QPS64238.1 DUF3156 family protein [Serratia plymuthica]RKS63351.1 uncharacterized protein DUF3156 [Serratia plymuthica]CAI2405844.1 Protein of uncharacterised function (DUF3156) [Serratia plymuthica]SQI30966.1 Protein of uncharacterised function (DUF3156) [Serratia plymuthica]
MIGLLPSLNRVWRRQPAGYQPGVTLTRLAQNLQPYACELLAPCQLRLTLPQGPVIEVSERVSSLFMAHIVSHRFRVQGASTLAEPLTLRITAGGWRRGVVYRATRDNATAQRVIGALQRYPQIGQTLTQLDFRSIQLRVADGRWWLDIEHFAASEVVSRLPAGRRYLRLEPEQRRLLLSSLLMIGQLMEKLDE